MAIEDKDGNYRTSWMNALMGDAMGTVDEKKLGAPLDAEDIEFINDIKADIERAKARGIENPIMNMPDWG